MTCSLLDRTGYCIFIVVTRVGAIKASDCRNMCSHNDQTTKRLSVPCAPDPLKAGKKISMELAKTSTDSTYNKYCGHCKQYLQERTFRNHKQKYYNKTTGKWQQESSKPALTTAGSGIEIQDPFADIGSDDTGSDVAEPSCEIPPSDHQSDPTDHDASSAPETPSSEESDIHGSEEDTDDNGSGEGEEEWERSDEEQQLLRDLYSSAVQAAEPQTKAARPDPVVTVVTWLLTFLVIWQAHNHISDNSLEHLMSFLYPVFEALGIDAQCLRGLSSLYMTWKLLGINRDNFQKFCVCPDPKCCKLFPMDQLYDTDPVNGVQKPRRCDNVRKVRKRYVQCNTVISRQTKTPVSKRTVFYPLKVFCFKSIIETLEVFVQKQGFEDKCEAWRDRNVSQAGLFGDVFEGKVWQDFAKWNGEDFLSAPRNYALMMNVDWFQPFKRRNDYSVGVIYMTIMNLPRAERFRLENVILVGIVPALEHEPKHLSSFLDPIVTELKFLWQGISFKTYNSPYYPLRFRAALLCCASDIPAARKLCGFLGHAALLGCSKCKKLFERVGTKNNYSGFDKENWPPRSDNEHRQQAQQIRDCTDNVQRQKLEKRFGTRYTPLLELEYYQGIRFCVIDPMHNLFLGTAKRLFKEWIDRDIITKANLAEISERIDKVSVPAGIGRLPRGIASNYGAFTAEEWKNWTLYYSSYCLDGILPTEHFDCWQLFILACKRLCQPVVKESDVNYADAAFVNFGRKVERLYGELFVTPNMHLHCHLKSCVLDYGPVYGFWLFSFERFNGILGSECTNNRGIEIQLMRKFLISGFAHSVSWPDTFREKFGGLFESFFPKGDYSNVQTEKEMNLLTLTNSTDLSNVNWAEENVPINLPKNFTRAALSRDDKSFLTRTYTSMYPESRISNMAESVRKYGTCQVGQEHFGSRVASRSSQSAYVVARWVTDEGKVDPAGDMRPGVIQYFYKHVVQINDDVCSHVFAVVRWYESSPMKDKIGRGRTCTVWNKSFVRGGSASFIPVQRIHGRMVYGETVIDGRKMLVVSPVSRKAFL